MNKIQIVIDAMGGDFSPNEIVKGAILAASENSDTEMILVGQAHKINPLLPKDNKDQIKVVDAQEVIAMDEPSAKAVKQKPNSSIVVGMKLVKEGQAQAFISAGNTGAVMAAALLFLGRIRGISRPAIAVTLPTAENPVVLLDAGANSDCRPEHLFQFSKMGCAYSKSVLKVNNPSVGLLSIGQEKGKGGDLVKLTHDLLEKSDLNFYGNIEGRDVSVGTTDVVVTDGFIGNIVLKTMEGLASVLFAELKSIINSAAINKVGGFLLSPALKKMQKRLNHDTYGGAQLLGVNNVCIISHGSAKAVAIKNAIEFAKKTVKEEVVSRIAEEVRAQVLQ